MKYHLLNPEVIVGLGEEAIMDSSHHPPTVEKLHINLEDWLGDDLMECFPVYIISERLKKGIAECDFTGYEIRDLSLTQDIYFEENYSLEIPLPEFYWLHINGEENRDDLFLNKEFSLMVSERVLEFLQRFFTINYCDIDNTDDFEDLFEGIE